LESVKGHVVFDFDGTVVSNKEALKFGLSIYKSKIKSYSLSNLLPFGSIIGNISSFWNNWGKNERELSVKQRMIISFGQITTTPIFNYQAFDGIPELIRELSSTGYSVYIWTARDRYSTMYILKELGLLGCFNDLRCSDDTKVKPHPAGLKEMFRDVSKNSVILIGNSKDDILGAKSFGCSSIGALWGQLEKGQELKNEGASFLAKSPTQCKRIIDTYFKKLKSNKTA
jgi:phosphoglycolate phosphatase